MTDEKIHQLCSDLADLLTKYDIKTDAAGIKDISFGFEEVDNTALVASRVIVQQSVLTVRFNRYITDTI